MSEIEVYSENTLVMWDDSIAHASATLLVQMPHVVRLHLGQMLYHGLTEPECFKHVYGLELLAALAADTAAEELLSIADSSILLAGLFPGRATTLSVNVGDLVDVSAISYQALAHFPQSGKISGCRGRDFFALGQSSMAMVDVLLKINADLGVTAGLTVADAQALWRSHRSRYAGHLLCLEGL